VYNYQRMPERSDSLDITPVLKKLARDLAQNMHGSSVLRCRLEMHTTVQCDDPDDDFTDCGVETFKVEGFERSEVVQCNSLQSSWACYDHVRVDPDHHHAVMWLADRDHFFSAAVALDRAEIHRLIGQLQYADRVIEARHKQH
jgi:hypothetical protein